jgi:Immunoglobulin domain
VSSWFNYRKHEEKTFVIFRSLSFLPTPDAPIVSLSLGSNLDPKNLAKGTDVYLECRIEANPQVKKIEWYHNNKPLQPIRGVIITNQSLVLQSISKQTHGQYMCRASNTQGSVSSNDLYLDIKCEFTLSWCELPHIKAVVTIIISLFMTAFYIPYTLTHTLTL